MKDGFRIVDEDKTYKLNMVKGVFNVNVRDYYVFLRLYSEIFKNQEHQQDEGFYSSEGLIIDIGACEGYYTIALASNSQNNCKIIAFEPNPFAFKTLEKNIISNRLSKIVRAEQFAISDNNSDTAEFVYVEGVNNIGALSNSNSRSSWLDSDYSSKMQVRTIRMDEYLKKENINEIDILKIDAEGSEFKVLNSFGDFIKNINKIVVECHSAEDKRSITEYLSKNGFKIIKECEDDNPNFTYLGNIYFRKLITNS